MHTILPALKTFLLADNDENNPESLKSLLGTFLDPVTKNTLWLINDPFTIALYGPKTEDPEGKFPKIAYKLISGPSIGNKRYGKLITTSFAKSAIRCMAIDERLGELLTGDYKQAGTARTILQPDKFRIGDIRRGASVSSGNSKTEIEFISTHYTIMCIKKET